MKYLLTTLMLWSTMSWASIDKDKTNSDSLVVIFGNKTRLVIHSEDRKGIQELSRYDINKIVRDMGMKLDSTDKNQIVVVDQNNTVRYLRDTVIVVTRKNGNVSVTIRESGKDGQTEREEVRRRENYNNDRGRSRRYSNDWNRWSVSGIGLGLNTLVEQSTSPRYPSENYDLRPIGSRYISLAVGQMPTLARGRVASLKLYYGLELAWNNFMFEGNNTIRKEADGVAFPTIAQEVEKSKLTIATIGIPFVPRVTFYSEGGRKVFHLGVGPYVNYRIDSYAKVKFEDDDKDRSRSNYYLNDVRYGLMAHIGIAKTSFFVKYDLNPLFQENRGPDVRALSFGISL